VSDKEHGRSFHRGGRDGHLQHSAWAGRIHPEQDLRDLIDASPAIGFVPQSRLSADAIIELPDRSVRGRADGTWLG